MAKHSEAVAGVFAGAEKDIDKYMALRGLRVRDPDAYYRLLTKHTEEILPYVYTPTVGEACQKYSNLNVQTTGLYISLNDRGRVLEKLRQWPHQDVTTIVATDGERILGLGDLGAGGMGISEGKILLYTAAAGVAPTDCLPICLDVGTNNEQLLSDPAYIGLRQRRPTGEAYFSFIEEFVAALKQWQPHVLLQFEDFGNHTAFLLLQKYRNQVCCFNDDIQGTAAITLSGILASLRLKRESLADQRILFHGAGEAGVGCGELIALALASWHGLSLVEARKRVLFMDSKGLVCKARLGKLQDHKITFAHDIAFAPDLLSVVRTHRPTVLIGVSTQAGAFSREVIEAMAAHCDRPVIFPLSNPTSKSECSYEEAFAGTRGRVIFASGSPFPPLSTGAGGTFYPAQANNAYIFPAVGHAAVLTRAKCIPEEVFLEAAACLAELSSDRDLACGKLFPSFSNIRPVSARIMARVGKYLCDRGFGERPAGLVNDDWHGLATASMYRVPEPKL
uniref:Malic enzyme n=2 Tax=Chloropicon laureae TaxID=464258 RepID=A0A7S3E223_9CHLO|mmetsp:Transcript_2607/g.6557  ORF Transcript_2607/g.6557 Transcript_2607/m.6557 type:complete len:506 (+) Transcript_2607:375-1892(+)|eukprot:CAMPEP_0197493008 /NCGR_PEP_ID=MMETSP1311-20131121/18117_1 /TAXON_ID=464262 /ORGANISM="Genus nov. species nov., Strain RCC856" /LENGTH=505 /DNA_ID=CAMNT_0043038167 /DNA_START=337 /DNA_END=1854 /DNA_ORIENTATION=-